MPMPFDMTGYGNKPKQAQQNMSHSPVVPHFMAGSMSGNVQTYATDG